MPTDNGWYQVPTPTAPRRRMTTGAGLTNDQARRIVRDMDRVYADTLARRIDPATGRPRGVTQDTEDTQEEVMPVEELTPEEAAVFDELRARRISFSSNDYGRWLESAFRFFRSQSAGRYTDRSMMTIARSADYYNRNADRIRNGTIGPETLPVLVVIDSPARYDELTETKYGGIVGMTVHWPTENGRTMIAVQRRYRRHGLGARMMERLMERHAPNAWVHQTNAPGQQFLLSCGLVPNSFNSAGGVRYGQPGAAMPEGEDAAGGVEPY